MAIAFSLKIPKEAAAHFCDSSEAARLINDKLSQKFRADRPQIFYSSTSDAPSTTTTSNYSDLDLDAMIVFAKDKKHLIRCLRGASHKEFGTETAMISIVANTYSGDRLKSVLESISNPFASLNQKRKVNWHILKTAGGVFRNKYQEVWEQSKDRITKVKAEPLQYEPWGSFYNEMQGATSARSGYYIVLATSRDLAYAYDVLGKRSYSAPRKKISAGAVASLLNFA